ncbi:MAG: pseudaminic acid synthase [Candidatus Riflebacteria bacterium]|nr:pseudaminic acid synthase [Candidatus Riflebacteria bacterium]
MNQQIVIGKRAIGKNEPVFVIAEISANHGGNIEHAEKLVRAIKDAGADAVKLQTYTPDTITMKSSREYFKISGGTLWDEKILYDLYKEAYMPWEWQPKLKEIADEIGIILFSTAFDPTAVDFLEKINVPVHKVASFELVDIPLIKKMASTHKPMIMSTGMGSLGEIDEAFKAANEFGAEGIALLKCTSAYPAPYEEMNLKTIQCLSEIFDVPVGLSDHSLGITVPVASVALGACLIEKHVTLSRSFGGPDSAFSLEPGELKEMIIAVRAAEKAIGKAHFGISGLQEEKSRCFRRSLFVVSSVKKGEMFSYDNIRSIRPANGLHPKFLDDIIGRTARFDIEAGTPLSWDAID